MADRALPRDLWTGNPEDFNQGGRDNIDVEIIKSRYAPDHYPNKTKHFCFFRITYRSLEDESDIFTERYRVGFLNSALPTNSDPDSPKEDREPAGGDDALYNQLAEGAMQLEENELEDFEGLYLMGRPQKGDDFLVWLAALVECGYQPDGPDASQFEGLQVHLDRGKGNTYTDKESGQEKASSILLPSAILKKGKASKSTTTTTEGKASTTKSASKPATTTTAKAKSASNGNNSVALDAIAEAIREIIENDGDDGSIEKGRAIIKLTKKEQFKGLNAADRKMVADAFNDDSLFTTARGLVYDPDDDKISAI